MSNPYRSYVSAFARRLAQGAALPLGGFEKPRRRAPGARAPRVLVFAPHPDDECIIGGLPLRLLRERRLNVLNVAVTLGSRPDRRAARLAELEAACGYIGFGLIEAAPGGLENIHAKSRLDGPAAWAASAAVIARILAEQKPRAIFFPHDNDWNVTHIGTHHLVMDALASLGPAFSCLLVETEFWGAMATPNLMVESSVRDVADLVAAVSFHAGEVSRNAYHLRLPAWMQDNVRRGGELVGGQGGAAPSFAFATLYRLRRWANARVEPVFDGGRRIACGDDLGALFSA